MRCKNAAEVDCEFVGNGCLEILALELPTPIGYVRERWIRDSRTVSEAGRRIRATEQLMFQRDHQEPPGPTKFQACLPTSNHASTRSEPRTSGRIVPRRGTHPMA